MAQFDKSLRRETHVFQEIARENGRSLWRRMQFNLVQYDGEPDLYIEPRIPSDFLDVVSVEPDTLTKSDGVGVIADMQFFQARPYEVHSFNDNVDV